MIEVPSETPFPNIQNIWKTLVCISGAHSAPGNPLYEDISQTIVNIPRTRLAGLDVRGGPCQPEVQVVDIVTANSCPEALDEGW